MDTKCEHDFIHLDTKRKTESSGYNSDYTRTDYFYCKKCLIYDSKTLTASSRDKPMWY